MSSFQNLHIRLPSGSQTSPNASSNSVAIAPQPPGAPPPFHITGVVETTNQMAHYHGHSHHNNPQTVLGFHPNGSIKTPLMEQLGLFKIDRKPRDLSLFSGLKSLAVLDIDDLNYIPEVANCITSSSASIRSVKFSLSEHFAMKARKPNGGYSDSESMSEVDEFGWNQNHVAAPGASAWGTTIDPVASAPPPNDPEVRRVRMSQEAILSEIFGLEEPTFQIHVDHALEQAIVAGDQRAQKIAKLPSRSDEDKNFVQVLRQMVQILPAAVYSGSGSSRSLKALELIEKATSRYLERMDQGAGDEGKASASSSSKSKNKKAGPKGPKLHANPSMPLDKTTVSDQESSATPNVLPESSEEPCSLTMRQEKTDEYISSVVDMEHPDEVEEEGEDQEFVDPDGGAGSHTPVKKPGPTSETKAEYTPSESSPSFSAGRAKGKQAIRELQDAAKSLHADAETNLGQSLDEYIRSTHGLPLDSLSIYLIPVKATVLCRAVDVFALKHLSLLNVGHQRVLWTMLAKLHQIRPLQLTSIHTDNVTPSFLSFVNGLDRVTELFMIEGSSRAKMESFAPRTTVKIEDIKHMILNKHIKHLRRLIIRNDDTPIWALNSQTARYIAAHGPSLVELAVGLNSSSYVSSSPSTLSNAKPSSTTSCKESPACALSSPYKSSTSTRTAA